MLFKAFVGPKVSTSSTELSHKTLTPILCNRIKSFMKLVELLMSSYDNLFFGNTVYF